MFTISIVFQECLLNNIVPGMKSPVGGCPDIEVQTWQNQRVHKLVGAVKQHYNSAQPEFTSQIKEIILLAILVTGEELGNHVCYG